MNSPECFFTDSRGRLHQFSASSFAECSEHIELATFDGVVSAGMVDEESLRRVSVEYTGWAQS